RDRRRQPLRPRRRRQVVVLLPDRTARWHRRPPRHVARLDAAARPAPGQDPLGGARSVSAGRGQASADARAARVHGVVESGPAAHRQAGEVRRDLRSRAGQHVVGRDYRDDKKLINDLSDIMNAEFRELAAAGCPLIQVEEPPQHGRTTRPDCTDADLEFLTEAFNRQLVGVDAEIWVHTCWGNPNQQRVYWEPPSY